MEIIVFNLKWLLSFPVRLNCNLLLLNPKPIRVLVTGAAGQIAYSLIPMLLSGNIFGAKQTIILHLLEIPQALNVLNGVVMEIEDCAYELLHGIVATSDVKEAFSCVDVAFLVGSMPRREGMERKDLLAANVKIFKEQGKALNDYTNGNVLVLVVGNPANTNCYVCAQSAPNISRKNFAAMTFLDQNRARGMIAKKMNIPSRNLRDVFIWGNHSSTQVPDAYNAVYGDRRNWVPRNQSDYGDGGAYPEVRILQYPLGMGRPDKKTKSNAIALQFDGDGKVKYDLIARQGHAKDRIVYSKLSDLLPNEVLDNDRALEKPADDDVQELTEKTRQALQKLTNSKIAAALPVRCAAKTGPEQFIRYTQSEQNSGEGNGETKQRIIRLVEAQVDPMEPPKFQINAKIPRAPPSPPAPVLHSPTRRVTAKEQKEWKIPPCISNWKNAKGYTVPLDKRLAADGRGLQQVHINDKFAKLAEALYIADRKAREAVETRAQLERKLAQKEKDAKEEHLRQLAQKAREERSGLVSSSHMNNSFDADEKQRQQLRQERHKERARERNLTRANPEKRSQLQRERERDISEQIALQMPPKTHIGEDAQFDQRLFAQSAGLAQGFHDDEAYNVYDKPWRDSESLAQHLYRPKNIEHDQEIYGDDIEQIANTDRFVPYKEFSGTDRNAERRSGPVQFEKEDDPFGLDLFLTEAKRGTVPKRKDDTASSSTANKRRR